MWMRKSMAGTDWWKKRLKEFNESLCKAFPNENPSILLRLHPTRVYEWPWAMEFCEPQGQVLDIGSDPQFYSSLVVRGINTTAHHTWVDTDCRGRIFPWEEKGISMHKLVREFKHSALGVFGLPGDMKFIQDDWFDTIYCLSVLEHLETKEEVASWMDGMKRILRPGGRLCVTCDWFSKWAIDDGMRHNEEFGTAYVMNWDLWELVRSFGDIVVGNERELPWHPHFDPSSLQDQDLIRTTFVGQELIVYGFVLEKIPKTLYRIHK